MPYAYGATIEHEFDTNHLNVWLTFRFPMETTSDPLADPVVHDVMPPLGLWLLEADDVSIDIVDSAWQDEFTLLLTSDTIAIYPDRVLLEYDGPNSNLQTTWGKDWEPWGPILSTDIGTVPSFFDRGDPAVYDWTEANFIEDGNWYDLDLSSIVPAGAKTVLFTLWLRNTLINKDCYLREKDNVNEINMPIARTSVANIYIFNDMVCACDTDRKIQYKFTAGGVYTTRLIVRGWWF